MSAGGGRGATELRAVGLGRPRGPRGPCSARRPPSHRRADPAPRPRSYDPRTLHVPPEWLRAAKVYTVTAIVRDGGRLARYNVVLNRKGLLRVERVPAAAPRP